MIFVKEIFQSTSVVSQDMYIFNFSEGSQRVTLPQKEGKMHSEKTVLQGAGGSCL
jgi:hypothetical protein